MMYFPGIYLVGQADQRHTINGKMLEVVIGLQLYGLVWRLTLLDHIDKGNYVLTNNG